MVKMILALFKITSFNTLLDSGLSVIERILSDGEIRNNKIKEIKGKFAEIGSVIKLRAALLSDDNSLRLHIANQKAYK